MITGKTKIIGHFGYPTESFKAPMIYNPWFESQGIGAVVVPLGIKAEDYRDLFRNLFRITNMHGALVTMPHKVVTAGLVDEVTATAKIAGACNAVLRRADGSLLGDMFDGAGFARGVERKGWFPAAAASAPPLPPRSQPPGRPRWRFTMPIPPPPKRWRTGCAHTIRPSRSAPARTIRRATISLSTQPRSV
jgi:hypothetical protein